MHSKKQPIGVFDSGLGGLSVWQELVKILPHETFIYYADRLNCPYGAKSPEEIIQLTVQITDFLLTRKCKLVVLACNTATAAAINYLRDHYEIPFVGMEPAIKPAASQSQTSKVGVLATQGTVTGGHFQRTRQRFAQHVEVFTQVGEGLVELVENGKSSSPEARILLEQYLRPMLVQGIDQLVLGCTHYPFFIPLIEEITQGRVQIQNPAPAVARRVQEVLRENGLLNNASSDPSYLFFSSGAEGQLRSFVEQYYQDHPRRAAFVWESLEIKN